MQDSYFFALYCPCLPKNTFVTEKAKTSDILKYMSKYIYIAKTKAFRECTAIQITLLFYYQNTFLFDLILYVPSTVFQLFTDGPSWVEPVLSKDKCVLLKDTTQ